MAPRKVTVPAQTVSVDVGGSAVRPEWYEKLKYLETLQPLTDIENPTFSVTTVTPGNTTTSITNRTVTDAGNASLPGTDTGVLGVGTVSNPQQNGWTTLMNVVNSFSTNHTNHKNAADALNTRVTALENKLNAVINDLRTRFP